MNVDLFSMIQCGQRHISFMCQSLGLMANLDLGTEHLRFMGSQYVHPCDLCSQQVTTLIVYLGGSSWDLYTKVNISPRLSMCAPG